MFAHPQAWRGGLDWLVTCPTHDVAASSVMNGYRRHAFWFLIPACGRTVFNGTICTVKSPATVYGRWCKAIDSVCSEDGNILKLILTVKVELHVQRIFAGLRFPEVSCDLEVPT